MLIALPLFGLDVTKASNGNGCSDEHQHAVEPLIRSWVWKFLDGNREAECHDAQSNENEQSKEQFTNEIHFYLSLIKTPRREPWLFRPVDLRPDQDRLLRLLGVEQGHEFLEHGATFKLKRVRGKLVRGPSPPTLELT